MNSPDAVEIKHELAQDQMFAEQYPAALKTAEMLLRLPPLSIYDWRATALSDVVGDAPSTTPAYKVVRPATAFLVPPPWQTSIPAGAKLPR